MGWLVKFRTIINMLTLLLGDKIITKPTTQLNMMFLHMVIYFPFRNKFKSFFVKISKHFLIKKQKKIVKMKMIIYTDVMHYDLGQCRS